MHFVNMRTTQTTLNTDEKYEKSNENRHLVLNAITGKDYYRYIINLYAGSTLLESGLHYIIFYTTKNKTATNTTNTQKDSLSLVFES